MTKKEFLEKAGYIPKFGRPRKCGSEPLDCRITIGFTRSTWDAMPEDRQAFIRQAVEEKLNDITKAEALKPSHNEQSTPCSEHQYSTYEVTECVHCGHKLDMY